MILSPLYNIPCFHKVVSRERCYNLSLDTTLWNKCLPHQFNLANRPERECPSRRYVFERHARKRLKLPASDLKEIMVANRTECEDKCLGEFSFVCRSATYDSALRTCSLSRFTRRTHPELLEDDHNADYLENTCLNGELRDKSLFAFSTLSRSKS